MAELHALGHHMIDMKPINLRFYPEAWYMAILDTDGFSINGPRRLPARQFSDEYIAPEARGKLPESLGVEQDLFALATIIFRLMNNGLHPYQGVDTGNYPTTLQERIFAGLFAYGQRKHPNVKPAPASLHGYFEDATRTLFDRAFQTNQPRPTSAEWRDHLNGLITNKTLVKCATDPLNHAHFSKGCGLCAQVRTAPAHRPVQAPAAVLNTLSTAKRGYPRPTTQARYPTAQILPARKKRSVLLRNVAVAGALLLGLYAIWPRPPNAISQPSGDPATTAEGSQFNKITSVPTTASGTQLASTEMDALRERIRQCWRPPPGIDSNSNIFVSLRVLFKPDGSLAQRPVVVAGTASSLKSVLAESGMRAILTCQPFTMLKPEHYPQWKDVTIDFNPRDMPDQKPGGVQSAQSFVWSFYNWYLPELVGTPQTISSQGDLKHSLHRWLTARLIDNWQKTTGMQHVDSLTLSQDYKKTWTSNIKALVTYESAKESTVAVSFGNGSDQQRVRVHLAMTASGWRIASVTPDEVSFDANSELSYDGQHPESLRITNSALTLTIDSTPDLVGTGRSPVVTIYKDKSPIFAFNLGHDFSSPNGMAKVRLVRLDPATQLPQVVLTSYSGGAHCCTSTSIATIDPEGHWHSIDPAALDGDFGSVVSGQNSNRFS